MKNNIKKQEDMNAKHFVMALSATGLATGGCATGATDGVARFAAADQDLSVAAGDDFYQFSNGGWMVRNPLPDDKSRLGTFDILFEENNERLRLLVEDVCVNKGAAGSASQKIGDLYSCGLDTAHRNAEGIAALKTYFEMIAASDTPEAFARMVGEMHKIGATPLFYFGRTPDAGNSAQTIAELWQSGIGLPDRDYYFDDSERGAALIEGYKKLLATFLSLVEPEAAAEARAEAVFEFEKALAEMMNTRVENRNPVAIYNKSDLTALKASYLGFDWEAFFAACGVAVEEINVGQTKFFGGLGSLIAATDRAVMNDYLTLTLVRSYANHLSDAFVDANFDFYGRQLSGSLEMRPLWKRVLSVVDRVLGEQIGQVYVEKYFPPTAKNRMLELVENLRVAFGQRIDKLTWMGDSTKVAAHEKLATISVKIGYPDKWTDYSELTIDRSLGYVANIVKASEFAFKQEMDKINKPVDRDEWYMTPQTVNAYYNPSANEIVFPAGILQPPFFYAEGDDAVNYGAIGVVIGHEMTHGFDDSGRQYDKDGNLNDWWSAADVERFEAITERLVSRFDGFVVVDSLCANGQLTLGENIADLGGLCISYQAFHNTLVGRDEPAAIDGQSADQRFVYAYSRIWAANVRDEYLHQQVKTDPHSPASLRVNGTLPLVDFFYNAFGIKEGDAMYVPAEERIAIW